MPEINLSTAFFIGLGSITIVASLGTILSRSPVTSALFLVLNFFALGGIYLLLEAQFIAVVQVIVYAGAIMVLFLFVIMLLNLEDEQRLTERYDVKKGFAILFAGLLLVELLYVVGLKTPAIAPRLGTVAAEIGTAKYIGQQLLTEFLFPFEIISILLLGAIVGAVVLAKKNFGAESDTIKTTR